MRFSRSRRSCERKRWPPEASAGLHGRGRARATERFHTDVRIVAAILALIAVVLMIVAIAGMVTGRPGDRAGLAIRAGALVAFVAAVVLNIASR